MLFYRVQIPYGLQDAIPPRFSAIQKQEEVHDFRIGCFKFSSTLYCHKRILELFFEISNDELHNWGKKNQPGSSKSRLKEVKMQQSKLKMAIVLEGLLTVDEFAAATGWKASTIRQKVWKREVEFVRMGRSIRFKPETVP